MFVLVCLEVLNPVIGLAFWITGMLLMTCIRALLSGTDEGMVLTHGDLNQLILTRIARLSDEVDSLQYLRSIASNYT